MGKKLNSRQQCASDVAGNVAGDKSLATGVHFRFGPCTHLEDHKEKKSYDPNTTFPHTFVFFAP